MTRREIVLQQIKFLRANCLGQLLDAVEQDFWLKVNQIFAQDMACGDEREWIDVKDED